MTTLYWDDHRRQTMPPCQDCGIPTKPFEQFTFWDTVEQEGASPLCADCYRCRAREAERREAQ